MSRHNLTRWGLVAAVCVAAIPALAAEASGGAASTMDNLQAAFNGESNAHARYVAFAKKADEEGYAGVASLFRAAARAEEIHAKNHAEVIKSMGGEAKAEIEEPEVKTTAENLKAAIAGESYERDTMYPEFIATAKKERNKEAVRTFNFAKAAEAEHAKLYSKALEELESWKTAVTFYICSVCGNTVTNIDFAKCPICFTSKDEYIAIK